MNQAKISKEHRRLAQIVWRTTPKAKESGKKSTNKYRNTINGKKYREKEAGNRRTKAETACCEFSEFEPI